MTRLFIYAILLVGFVACKASDPEAENEEEIITDVTLTFTPAGGIPIVATAKDPDGEGPQSIAVSGPIDLNADTEYTLTIELDNSVALESITEEIEAEADEHMFFFSWTDGAFSSPAGDGNIDNRSDAVNYSDIDLNSQPVGLTTTWTTSATSSASGTFRVVLKHQPNLKSATSTADDGETDVDLTWTLNIGQ